MGLLDDAIREHLDLKRRRGADPVEIERAEQEALGPVRRAPEGAEEDQLGPEVADAEGDEYDYEDEYEYEEEEAEPASPYAADEPVEPPAHLPLQEPAHHTFDEHLPPREPEDEPSDPRAPTRPSGETPAPHPAEPDRSRLSDETVEYQVEREPEGDEMLEETPEFLQDTPEHDRLWFEQRPPRDFDFEE